MARKALAEAASEASKSQGLDDHDFELLDAVRDLDLALERDLSRYTNSSSEHALERDALQKSGERLRAAIDRLSSVQDDPGTLGKLIGQGAVNTVVEETSNLTRSAQEFLEGLEADKEKERGLFSSAVLHVQTALQAIKHISSQYEFGTDLYRTYLNLLPIQVSTSFVVALPSYRDPGLQKEGNSAYERIQTAYRQLYAGVTLVPVSSDTFIKELGSVHCLSKILPDEIDFLTSDRNRAQLESHP